MARATTPSAVARTLGVDVRLASYHIQELHQAGMVRLVEISRSRGRPKLYEARRLTISAKEWAQLPAVLRRLVADAVLRELRERANAASTHRFAGADEDESFGAAAAFGEGWESVAEEFVGLAQLILSCDVQAPVPPARPAGASG
jgi:predicted ArsR family transcriptional regulator